MNAAHWDTMERTTRSRDTYAQELAALAPRGATIIRTPSPWAIIERARALCGADFRAEPKPGVAGTWIVERQP